MLEIKDLTISINDRYLIKNLNLILNNSDKLAIIGEEGNGKSTLLKSILGICEYAEISGNINLKGNRIGYLEQSISADKLDQSVYEFLFVDETDYYDKVNNLYKYLELINLTDDILKQKIRTLSGGEKVKISILKLLLNEYDILFLDEPTNDLDIETLEWLEKFINSTNKPIIYVSHDETLLANTANMILHLEQIKKKTECRHTLLKIGYDTYVEQRLRKIEKQTQVARSEKRKFTKQHEKLQRIMQKVEYQQNTISRADPHGAKVLKKKMHSLKSQEKKLDEAELTEVPDVEESISFFFEDVEMPRTKNIISLNIDELKVSDKILSKNIKLDVIGNIHLCIIGKNGVGKSTLIKLIYNELKDRNDIKVGYMPQTYDDILNNYEYVLDFISSQGNKEEITKARLLLGNMKFTKEEMIGKIKNLSNGSKAKLFLVKLVLDKCNVLILDEPTRNVSPLSNPIIRKVLSEYDGTIISVSHDRKYINETIDNLYILTTEGLLKEK
ncbi:MAG: ABC-F family ATP-binding cassette domain-containing protein [Clostridia bacterium]|nr:ABC-F family ATP-binding cassette domain-containing protein [Clostridia bacterium]